jgi:H+/Na+-translocating ferredoxin:NAD+ oxidoreductase subunit G
MTENGEKQGGNSRQMLMMVVALTLVTVVSAALLGLTDSVTRQPIYQAQRETLRRSLEQVLPAHANVPMDDVIHLDAGMGATPFYVARDANGAVQAMAWEVVAPDGYSGSIRILIGVLPDGTLHAVRVTDHHETPGLGDGIVTNRPWIDFFSGKSLINVRWAVKKDGGDFDQFTGATITPRAVVKAVHMGLLFFSAHHDELLARAAGK